MVKETQMINRNTVKILNLKPVTQSTCYDFYVKINSEFNTPEEIQEAVSWWQDDSEKLNTLWWVLNYYSEKFDPDRRVRSVVERYLDSLALKKDDSFQD